MAKKETVILVNTGLCMIIVGDVNLMPGQEMEIEKDKVQIHMDTPGGLEGADRPPTMLCANIPIRSIPNKGLY